MNQQEFQTAVIEHFQSLGGQMSEMNKRMDTLESRLAVLEERSDTILNQFRGMELQMSGMHIQLMSLQQSRNIGKIRFGAEWVIASFFIAVIAAGVALGFVRS
jgi:hypothetical protein